jgi:hypothetical protein
MVLGVATTFPDLIFTYWQLLKFANGAGASIEIGILLRRCYAKAAECAPPFFDCEMPTMASTTRSDPRCAAMSAIEINPTNSFFVCSLRATVYKATPIVFFTGNGKPGNTPAIK